MRLEVAHESKAGRPEVVRLSGCDGSHVDAPLSAQQQGTSPQWCALNTGDGLYSSNAGALHAFRRVRNDARAMGSCAAQLAKNVPTFGRRATSPPPARDRGNLHRRAQIRSSNCAWLLFLRFLCAGPPLRNGSGPGNRWCHLPTAALWQSDTLSIRGQ